MLSSVVQLNIKEKSNSRLRLIILCLLFAFVIAPNITLAADVLNTPAMMTSRWSTLLQLSVARAGKRIVSVGERGVILLSDDDGKSWRQAKTPVSTTLTRVIFPGEKIGWAVGHYGVILKSIDGGESWTTQFDGKEAIRLATAKGTASLGETQPPIDGAENPLLALYFIDEKEGFVAGAFGAIFKTEDGGAHWISLAGKLGEHNDKHIYDIKNLNGILFLVGEQGEVLESPDRGKTFVKVTSPSKGTYFGAVTSGTALIAFGLKGNAFISENTGKTWQNIKQNDTSVTAGLRLTNGNIVLGNEAGQLFKSIDNGKKFVMMAVKNTAPISDLVEASDGGIIRSGPRGVSRIQFVNENGGARE